MPTRKQETLKPRWNSGKREAVAGLDELERGSAPVTEAKQLDLRRRVANVAELVKEIRR